MPYAYEYPHPAVTADVVLFSIHRDALAILLIRRAQPPFQDNWALPGGFIDIDEELEEAARRELREETGIVGAYLEQLHTFGAPNRDPRERVITVAYLGLVSTDHRQHRAGSDAKQAMWFGVDALPELAFDHAEIIKMARARLAHGERAAVFALKILPETFSLSDLQRAYELLTNRSADKRNFRKRILTAGLIEETGEIRREGRHRPAGLYRVIDGR